jgi:hypothetical protein
MKIQLICQTPYSIFYSHSKLNCFIGNNHITPISFNDFNESLSTLINNSFLMSTHDNPNKGLYFNNFVLIGKYVLLNNYNDCIYDLCIYVNVGKSFHVRKIRRSILSHMGKVLTYYKVVVIIGVVIV